MKINLVSDLHLEFGYQELPGGEVLILAGDIAESRSIRKHLHSTKLVQEGPNRAFPCSEFFQHECAKYDKVFYVMGNHEHYHGRFDKTQAELISMMPANVTVLEDDAVEYNGVMFMGSTLWTDLNKGDPITAWHLKSSMNDYRVVQNHYPDRGVYHKLTPEHTREVHMKTKAYFKTMLELNRDKPFVVITHHGPSFQSVNEKYSWDTTMNGGYTSALDEFVLDHENIKVWVHGHMHDPVDYLIGETRVVSNPRGYIGHEDTSGFTPDFTFEV
jgi:Icc-related predicted phosphoesterase